MALKGEPLERKKRRQADRRQRILEAAQRVLNEKGLTGFTVNEVAKAADISGPSLYYYFKDKHEITDALLEGHLIEELEVQRTATDAVEGGVAALEAMMRARVGYYLKNPEAFVLFYAGIEQVSQRLLNEVVYPQTAAYNHSLEERIKAEQAAGIVVPEVDPRRLVNVAFCTAQGIIQIALAMQKARGSLRFSPDELLDEACANLRRGAMTR